VVGLRHYVIAAILVAVVVFVAILVAHFGFGIAGDVHSDTVVIGALVFALGAATVVGIWTSQNGSLSVLGTALPSS